MRRTPHVPRVLPSLGIAVALAAPLACSKSGETEAKPQETPAASTNTKDAEKPAETPTSKPAETHVPEGITKVVADATASGGGRLERGDALGHFVVPNASRLLSEVRTQATPAKSAAFLNEASLRAMASLGLGARAGLAEHIALDQPMGCVLVDDLATDVPVACAVGYAGGAVCAVLLR